MQLKMIEEREIKHPKDTLTVMTEMVLPNDTNPLRVLRGGTLLHWMDIASVIAAQKHCAQIVVTASVHNVSFKNPIQEGDIVTITAKVTRAFRTSMEVKVIVVAENILKHRKYACNEAFFTFVALNEEKIPIEVPKIVPETDEEKHDYIKAEARKKATIELQNNDE